MRERSMVRVMMVPLAALLSVVLGGCGLFDRLACIGDPAALGAVVEPETLTLAQGASGDVEVTVFGLSERCYPRATLVGFIDPPDGIGAEPIGVTAQEPTGTLRIDVAEEAAPDTYFLRLGLSAYPQQPVGVTLEVVAHAP